MQPSNKDEFEFSDSPPTSINTRTQEKELQSIVDQVLTVINGYYTSFTSYTSYRVIRERSYTVFTNTLYKRLSTVFIFI